MGVAGSGKSVQGRMLADELGLPWLSTGEFLRMLISGEKRKSMIKGKLLSDSEIIALVQRIFTIIDPHEEFVLDGFPRTDAQAEWLLAQVKHGQVPATAVVHLQASESVVLERLKSRGRPDDNDDAIRERLREYEESAKPIIAAFKAAGVPVVEVNGELQVDRVHQQIMSGLSVEKLHVHES